ncbi:LuxR C-terminal-related transcriptional regulator [Actinoallomurus sp. NBC_01490]|uniref:helix-turn-helix domain-containing protein n=1 Tax=Actinoallomurus sp. NBC_01490 TaxID=2903557 RepID=UPI002E35DC53|nr:helix-turn-helix domain-containing protein [Actinoallomurus sp. NBC_01490]
MLQDGRILAPLDVTAFDEMVYRELLSGREATARELASRLGYGPDRLVRALDRLRARGLVSRLSGRPRRYAAAEPDVALETLIRDREQALARLRTAAAEMMVLFRRERAGQAGAVEIVTGRDEVARRFLRLQHGVREEMRMLDRPPYVLAATNPVEPGALRRGVRWRAVYTPEALEQPGALEDLHKLASLGEQARVAGGIPVKLAIADSDAALVSLHMEQATAEAALVHSSALLDALIQLFEFTWEHAAPLGTDSRSPLAEEDRRLLTLLLAGLKDDAIARQLGLSTRTMRRRMKHLMELLGADNRFQAGAQAVRRGWI